MVVTNCVLTLSIFNTHIRERREGLKDTDSGVYPKGPNSWIHSIGFNITLDNECELKRFKACAVYSRVRFF